MTAALLDVYAKRDENGNPSLGDAQLVVGDGTVKVHFRQGHALVTEEVARLISIRSDLVIPGLSGDPGPDGPPAAGPFPNMPVTVGVDRPPPPEVRDEAVRLAKEHLEADGEEVPPILPPGFELRLADGTLRCLARKSDGSQCKNGATVRHGCGLQAHQDQLAGSD